MNTTHDSLNLMRFVDIKAKGIVNDRKTLKAWMELPPEKDPFPRPVRLSARSIAWRRVDVEAWIDRRIQR